MIVSWVLLIGYLIMFSIGMLDLVDKSSYQFLSTYINDKTTSLVIGITFLGSWISVVTICIICMIIHLKKGLVISVNVAIVWLMNDIIKNIVARARPSVSHLVVETTYSFPSAHAMVSLALFGFIAYFLWNKYKPLSIMIICIPLLIGLTRIYLGVHYTSDVIAGFLFSLTYLCTVIPILKYHKILPSS